MFGDPHPPYCIVRVQQLSLYSHFARPYQGCVAIVVLMIHINIFIFQQLDNNLFMVPIAWPQKER
jgi:hypothetical protein